MDSEDFKESMVARQKMMEKLGAPADVLADMADALGLVEVNLTVRLPQMLVGTCDEMVRFDPKAPTLTSLVEESVYNHLLGKEEHLIIMTMTYLKSKKKGRTDTQD